MADTGEKDNGGFPMLDAYRKERDMYEGIGRHVQLASMEHLSGAYNRDGKNPELTKEAAADYAKKMIEAQKTALKTVTGAAPEELDKFGDVTAEAMYQVLGLLKLDEHKDAAMSNRDSPVQTVASSERAVTALRSRYIRDRADKVSTDDELYGQFKEYVVDVAKERDDFEIDKERLDSVNRESLVSLAHLLRDNVPINQIRQQGGGLENIILPK